MEARQAFYFLAFVDHVGFSRAATLL